MKSDRFLLGIDTAGRHGSIALSENGTARAWETLAPGEHSSGISQAGARLLEGRNLAWKDLAAVSVSSGPGSFTGLRIGLAWAKGVCFGSGAKLVLVSAHEANAHRLRLEGTFIATVLQGERGEVQAALWSGGEGMRCLWGPESLPELTLAETLRSMAGVPTIAVAGPDMKPLLEGTLSAAGFRVVKADGTPPTAAAVAEIGDRKLLRGEEEEDLASAAPAYGRAPNARRPSP